MVGARGCSTRCTVATAPRYRTRPTDQQVVAASLLPMLQTILAALVVGAIVSVFANVCTTVYLHRALSHRALPLHPAVDQAFRFFVWITTGLRPRQWVAVHRKHHAFTD